MKMQLIARHIRDDIDHVLKEAEASNVNWLVQLMKDEIEGNKKEGSNWRYSIVAAEETYR